MPEVIKFIWFILRILNLFIFVLYAFEKFYVAVEI